MEQLLPQEVVDVIGDVVTHLMAEEEHPRKKDGPIVEEITEPGKEMSPEKEESDDGLDDLPDLECNVCFATFYAGYVNHNDHCKNAQPCHRSRSSLSTQVSTYRILTVFYSEIHQWRAHFPCNERERSLFFW